MCGVVAYVPFGVLEFGLLQAPKLPGKRRARQRKRRPSRWHAWIRVQSFGKKSTADLRHLSLLYKQAMTEGADTPLGQSLQIAGRLRDLARAALKRGVPVDRVFGGKRRDIQRKQRLEQRTALQLHTSGDPIDKALQSAQQSALLQTPLPEVSRLARSTAMQAANNDEEIESHIDAMLWFESTVARPELADLDCMIASSRFTVVPTSFGHVFQIVDEGTTESTKACATAMGPAFHRHGLNNQLGEQWQQQHESLRHDDCPPLLPDAPRPKGAPRPMPLCKDLGFCRCTPLGRDRLRARNAFLLFLRAVFKPKSEERTKLNEGQIVCRVWVWDRKDDEDDDEFALGDDFWYHIGFCLLNPFLPTFHKLARCEGPPEGDRVGRLYLKVLL